MRIPHCLYRRPRLALGLYFTPAVLREIVRLAPWVAATTAFAIALGVIGHMRHVMTRRKRQRP